jgi:segregation and condensation protein A
MSAESPPSATSADASAPGYRVRLPMYEGPADLLLYLVRRNELDVCGIPLAQITAQFLEYLAVLQLIDFDSVGEFVVVASTLVEMKSRQVLAGSEQEEEDAPPPEATADGPAAELVEQLLQYRKYREAARELEHRAARWQERYPRLSSERPEAGKDPAADRIREVELWDLVSALARVLRRQVADEHSSIRYDDTPISVHIERVGERVRAEGQASFSSFFQGEGQRVKIVSIFLAILELIRHHRFRAEQPDDFGEIWILPPAAEAEKEGDAAAESGEAGPADDETLQGQSAEEPPPDTNAEPPQLKLTQADDILSSDDSGDTSRPDENAADADADDSAGQDDSTIQEDSDSGRSAA